MYGKENSSLIIHSYILENKGRDVREPERVEGRPGGGESVIDEQRAEGSRIGFTTVSFCGTRGKYGRHE